MNRVSFINESLFQALQLCDGSVNVSLPLVPQESRDNLNMLERQGVIERCAYGVGLSDEQRYRKYDARYVQVAHWSITGKCNYKCKHCYMSAPDAKLGELSHDEIMRMIDEIAECGIMQVSLTGGEPLIRADFEEILAALAERHIWITQIYSNGFKVRPALLDSLDRYGFKPEFNMSYDGDEGWHSWLRGIPAAGEHVLRAFDLCHERGFPTGAEMCLHQGNRHLLRESLNTLAAHHVGSCKVNPVSDTDYWRQFGKDYTLSVDDTLDVYVDYVPHFFEDGMPLSLMLGGLFHCAKGQTNWSIPMAKFSADFDCSRATVCGHARTHLYISPEGRMLPCLSLSSYEVQGNYPLISEIGLRQGLSDSAYMSLIDTRVGEFMQVNAECNNCEFRNVCAGGCRASALAFDESNILGTDRAACAIFKGGYVAKVTEAASGALERTAVLA